MNRVIKKLWRTLTLIGLTGLFVYGLHFLVPFLNSDNWNNPVLAQEKTLPKDAATTPKSAQKLFPVVLDDKTLFYLSSGIPGMPAKIRAERVSKTIEKIAEDTTIPLDSIKVFDTGGGLVISSDEEWLFAIVQADAKAAKMPLERLAQDYLTKVKEAIAEYREKRGLSRILWGGLWAAISTLVLIILFKLLNFLFPLIHRTVEQSHFSFFVPVRIQNWQLLSAEEEASIFFGGLKILRRVIVFALLYIYIPLVLSFFPLTERLGKAALNSFYSAVGSVWSSFLNYLPNLFIIVLVVFLTYYTIRLCRPLFQALEQGNVTIRGFYPEWAEPTYNILVFLIMAIAAAIAFPYLPGFNSPAFQGISILLGALVTFGGASTIANLFGGIIIIYTRAFRLGDRISIDKYTGIVIEKTIMSTRICTPNNEIVTIPNASIIASSITNYSASLRDINQPLVLHTTITLGYDLPWRKVHETLINAALATTDILQDPPPYVWQTSLDDFFVSYEVRAYTDKPIKIKEIYSELHQNIQDKCNEVGIEIMSPHYSALRDGNQTTIPENYLDQDYSAPGFRIQSLSPTTNDEKLS